MFDDNLQDWGLEAGEQELLKSSLLGHLEDLTDWTQRLKLAVEPDKPKSEPRYDFGEFGLKNAEYAGELLEMMSAARDMISDDIKAADELALWISRYMSEIGDSQKVLDLDLPAVALAVMGGKLDDPSPGYMSYDTTTRDQYSQLFHSLEERFKLSKAKSYEIKQKILNIPTSKSNQNQAFDFKDKFKRIYEWYLVWEQVMGILGDAYNGLPVFPGSLDTIYNDFEFDPEENNYEPDQSYYTGTELQDASTLYDPITDVVRDEETAVAAVPKVRVYIPFDYIYAYSLGLSDEPVMRRPIGLGSVSRDRVYFLEG
ncbi:hypothetical protein ABW19_dt0210323 [Dactylella cylindrospora]|nr:hypothetical protein ABW19_dt0210323 [Dactylella cylindrospora]